MAYDPRQPHDGLPALPPAVDVESKSVLKQCLAATRALAELKGAGRLIPDQSILINAIPLQEARLSSEIENIVTTQDELFRATLNESAVTDPATKEVLRYRTALKHGCRLLRHGPLSIDVIRDICRVLRDMPGLEFRSPAERVAIGNATTRHITYTPPSGGAGLIEKLRNLVAFLGDAGDIDPLVRMAISHYQFEAIHPFTDGNGRTGRILNILYLIQAELLDIPVLYLSRFIIRNKSVYYRRLRDVTENGDWESWLLYILAGVEETALWTSNRIHAVYELREKVIERCRNEIPKVYSRELIDLVFRQPYCKIGFIVDAGLAKRKTASVWLQELNRIGILTGEKIGREMIYKHPALLELLTA
ncbi:MAG: Fic family protein [Lentisphaerae bacterium]|jgi:Fic family protein|nr:Fic family protein [Lentisphaerota bacterium]MBT4822499.1 Fic family protein [Lentisphaerota bacterium]MBT5606037.1 Fic family protein [Lentisphaerota bacterium]MBT7058574.1 Fic family protein [Lentisphaerota bacterium]MBT7845476.1 Fic family protein [Lentisphaerota bacterium]